MAPARNSRQVAGYYLLQPGVNTIRITDDWGFYNVDYIDLKPATPPAPLPIAPTLSDPNATASTKVLMNYLTSIYGSKTLASQQGPITNAYSCSFRRPSAGDERVGSYRLFTISHRIRRQSEQ